MRFPQPRPLPARQGFLESKIKTQQRRTSWDRKCRVELVPNAVRLGDSKLLLIPPPAIACQARFRGFEFPVQGSESRVDPKPETLTRNGCLFPTDIGQGRCQFRRFAGS